MKKVIIPVIVILAFACKEREGEYYLKVSFDRSVYTIDVLRDTVVGNDTIQYFPYYKATASFSFGEYQQTTYEPVVIVDSFKIFFYNLSTTPPSPITLTVASEYSGTVEVQEYKNLFYSTSIEIPNNQTVDMSVPILPSFIIQMYDPFYGIWKNNNPQYMEIKAIYRFYSHEFYSGKNLKPLDVEIKLEVSNFIG